MQLVQHCSCLHILAGCPAVPACLIQEVHGSTPAELYTHVDPPHGTVLATICELMKDNCPASSNTFSSPSAVYNNSILTLKHSTSHSSLTSLHTTLSVLAHSVAPLHSQAPHRYFWRSASICDGVLAEPYLHRGSMQTQRM